MTSLEIIDNKQKKENKRIIPYKITSLNNSQIEAIKEVENNTLTTVIGAAGTGKSSTITALASHFILTGRKVLIVSKSEHATDVNYSKLNDLNIKFLSFRAGRINAQKELNQKIMDVLKTQKDDTKVNKIDFIKYFLSKDENIAKKILSDTRKEQINNLLSNDEAMKNLLILAKSCNVKKKSQKNKILETINFDYILQAIPCFCITTAEISNILPLKKDIFDLVICDESSEVDIASFLPCMFRAKKACVIGDDKQLKSLNFLDNKKNKTFIAKNEIPADLELVWDYRKNSLFDFCQYYTQKCILLNIQYRMPENLFRFNNEQFYQGMIKSYKTAEENALQKIFVNGKTDVNKTQNLEECKAIMKDLKTWLKENKDNNKTVAVLSMFNSQVELIKKVMKEVISYKEIEKHKIEVLTANSCQGKEFDVCFISWVIDNECKHQSITFINNNERFNVITSRAREKVVNYYSKDNMSDCLLNKYLCSIESEV